MSLQKATLKEYIEDKLIRKEDQKILEEFYDAVRVNDVTSVKKQIIR